MRKPSPASGTDWIWGLHSIEACLQTSPEVVLEILLEANAPADVRRRLQQISGDAGLQFKEQKTLPGVLSDKRTQGVAARLKEFPQESYSDFEDEFVEGLQSGQARRWAVLDSVQDPRNYGAVLRSAAAFGIEAVITGPRDQCPLTGVVAQASAGNVFRVRNVVANNLSRVLERARNEGAHVLGLDGDGKDLRALLKDVADAPVVWVLGSEGEGLRDGLMKQTTQTVRIPMAAGVESLNASVAASLAFYSTYAG